MNASPPGEGAAEDKSGGNLLPEVQLGRGEVRVRGKFRVMDWGRVRVTDRVESGGWAGSRSGSGSRSELGSRIEAGKGGASLGGSPAGRLGPVHPTTCLSTCSQGGGSTCWGNGEEVARALPWVAVLHTS